MKTCTELADPDHDTHRRVNTFEAVKLKMVQLAKSSLEGNEEGEIYHSWHGKDTTSTSVNTGISKTPIQSQSKSRVSYKCSILSVVKTRSFC